MPRVMAQWSKGGSTRFYDFKVQMLEVNKLCNIRNIVTINQMYPGPVVYAQEDDRVIVKLTNESPYNATIHWHGVRQMLSCWSDGPSYITQCPVQPGQTFIYEFTLASQKGTLFWHAHFSWLRATVYGALIIYPKTGVPYPFKQPYEEHIVILGEYWLQDLVQLEKTVMASGTSGPVADAYTINGHPGPKYNCSANVEADGEYTKPFTTDRVMLGPGHTLNVLVTADQKIGRYSMAMVPYMSAQKVSFQNITSIAYFQYLGATQNNAVLPASLLPRFDDNLAVKTVMDGLRSLEVGNVPKEIDTNLFFTIGINVNKCCSKTPKQNCQGVHGGVMAASMNNNSFIKPIFRSCKLIMTILKDTGTVSTENHPIHLHGYSFYVVGYGSGNYDPQAASFNLVDPPYMNTIGVPVGGWAAIRFVADNPGVWAMHCHLEMHFDWGLSTALIVKNGKGPMETLPHPPPDMPHC
ncbi:hypothetical protein L1987_39159 [Smallanthus sonchifolius]|uniref:Uncharacterized protein n=1 Tax=Smallanthus sonchifolius TaxID=185202 RepID=A0ACB9HME5_9ASTR|nr:hypothetical protein L1987_39159 [Smallanthus sonchifolius]